MPATCPCVGCDAAFNRGHALDCTKKGDIWYYFNDIIATSFIHILRSSPMCDMFQFAQSKCKLHVLIIIIIIKINCIAIMCTISTPVQPTFSYKVGTEVTLQPLMSLSPHL